MNNEQYTVAEFVRGVTWAESMTARVTIAGRPYLAGELLADASDASGHEYMDEVFAVLTRVARNGDEAARDLIRRMGETFAYNNCEPEPEADDIPEPVTISRLDQPVHTFLMGAV